MPTLYLIDGSAYIYRAFFALPPLSNSKGLQTNAVYGFTTMMLKVLRDHRPDYVAAVFDEKGATHRHEVFKEYKAQRPPMPQGMSAQIPYIHRVVEALALPVIRQEGYEADDLIGTLARKAEVESLDVAIVTSDKDMFQLLTPKTRIYDPVKDKWFGEADSQARFGVEPARVVEIMGLMGDTSDNIPGVKGIGEKTAVKLITQFGTIEELLSRLEEVAPVKTKNLLLEQGENARLSRRLATIQIDCPIDFAPANFLAKAPHTETLVALMRELEFTTLAKAFQGDVPEQQRLGAMLETINDAAAAASFLGKLSRDDMIGLACVLTGGVGVRADVSGCAFGLPDGRVTFLEDVPQSWPEPISEFLGGTNGIKAVHDLKPLLLGLARQGLEMPGPYFDIMVADYLLNPNRRAHTVEAIAMDLLSYQPGGGAAEPATKEPASLFDAAEKQVRATAETAAVVAKVAPMLRERLAEQGSLALFQDVEMPLVPVLADIQRNGFLLDVEGLGNLSKELEGELDLMVATIYRLAGGEFNIGSPKQLATVLFETLGLKPLRKTKTGYSTDEDTLTQLATQHELPAQILSY
ncbi:MAG TPA: DNA polymerase, partial [Nitrospira sp.]|nr:DNA polymerase [Nitrospira sp.]